MGISGLLPLLKDAQEDIHISKYKGKVLGVDAYVWLHRGAYGCAQQLALGQPTKSYVNFAMNKVNMLRYHGIIPYIVFDGGHLPAKGKTEVEREKRRKDNLSQAKLHLAHGRSQQARDFFVKCVDVTPVMALEFIKALRAAGVDYIVAPYEADAQLAYLERRGTIQGLITEDSDLLVFGCKTVLYKLNDQGRCIELLQHNRNKCKSLQLGTFTDAHFRQMAILSGCDYLDSIPGMGLKTAHRLLKQCGSVARALSAARMEGMKVPPNYQKDFEMAEKTFVFQRVFHRSSTTGKTKLVTLTASDGGHGLEDEDCIGPLIAEDLIEGIARGDVDPITKLPIVEPNTLPSIRRSNTAPTKPSSFYAAAKPKWIRETAPPSAGQKTLDTFFSGKQTGTSRSISRIGEGSARQPLKPVTNVAHSRSNISDTEKPPEEKSKYFITATNTTTTTTTTTITTPTIPDLSSPIVTQSELAHLATFTPTQAKRKLSRCLSTDSGEISSPASTSSKKRSRDQVQTSSPLLDDEEDTSSPNTSPTIARPRKSIKEAQSPRLSGALLPPLEDSDIEEDTSVDVRFLQQYTFQATPMPTLKREESKTTVRSVSTTSTISNSSSSSTKRGLALLQFQDDDDENQDIFGDIKEQTTPLLQKSRSYQGGTSNLINKHFTLKRI